MAPTAPARMGCLQPIADAVKLIFKEELIPANADKLIFILAPVITVIPALIITAVVPWGTTFNLFGRRDPAVPGANVNVGVLYIMSVTSISVYGITLAGWSSNNKYATLGGLRATAQMISYELALGLAYDRPDLAGRFDEPEWISSMRKSDIWFIVYQPLALYHLSDRQPGGDQPRRRLICPKPNRN